MHEEWTAITIHGVGSVHSWASMLDDKTRDQASAIARVPIVEGHVALMPDAHFGFGPPVGSVIRTVGGVMPYAVGVDIGCGMIAVQTLLEHGQLEGKEGEILGQIRERIPSGVGTSHKKPTLASDLFFEDHGEPIGIGPSSRLENKKGLLAAQHDSLRDRARVQFGTLGSGNHFVEVCVDEQESVWLLLHSGSRGIGNVLATAHVNVAKAFCQENGIALENAEFAYVIKDTRQYAEYLNDMHWAQDYAYENRVAMMNQLIEAVMDVIPGAWGAPKRINCHHNYAEVLDDGSILTRKGAIDASVGKMGIIPGSMGTASYIVKGLGNEDAYNSSPHGAGREMSRKAARANITLDTFKAQMAGKTWLDRDAEELLDEAPDAYKPIDQVMEDSVTLVKPVTKLRSIINFKGTR